MDRISAAAGFGFYARLSSSPSNRLMQIPPCTYNIVEYRVCATGLSGLNDRPYLQMRYITGVTSDITSLFLGLTGNTEKIRLYMVSVVGVRSTRRIYRFRDETLVSWTNTSNGTVHRSTVPLAELVGSPPWLDSRIPLRVGAHRIEPFYDQGCTSTLACGLEQPLVELGMIEPCRALALLEWH